LWVEGRRYGSSPGPPDGLRIRPEIGETPMLFVLIAIDKKNALALRTETRAAHLDYAKQTGVVKFGGPFLDKNGDMAGSMLIFEAADMDAAKAWAGQDPYAKAGLFQRSKIRAWKLTFNPNNITL
jgi:uncharacterized protein